MQANTFRKHEKIHLKKKVASEDNTYIIGMPSNTCNRRIMSFPDKFTDPPAKDKA